MKIKKKWVIQKTIDILDRAKYGCRDKLTWKVGKIVIVLIVLSEKCQCINIVSVRSAIKKRQHRNDVFNLEGKHDAK